MKKYIVALAFTGCIGLSGCADLFQEPLSCPTPENIEYNQDNVTSLTDGLYRKLWFNNWGFNCRPQILGLGADDIIGGSVSKRHYLIDEFYVHGDDVDLVWEYLYAVIQASNQFIEGLEASPTMADEAKKPYLGEAYFMRAFAYFHLVRYFGDVPGFTDSTCYKDILGSTDITRNKTEDIYNLIIVPSLKIAEEYLPERGRKNNGSNETPSKWAAKACLADVYLTMAEWPLKKTENFALARDKAKEIIDEGGYSLLPHYEELWKEATKLDATEHMFALPHDKVNQASNYGISYMAMEESTAAWSDYLADSCFYERYPADERKAFNFITKMGEGKRAKDFRKTQMRSPAINKYRDYGGTTTANGAEMSAQSSGITPIYRYAEVLLIYAEAQNRAEHGPNTLAYQCLNDVRKRAAGGGVYDKAENMNEEEFDKAVFDEYGWEFFAEFKRWFQLVRTEKVWEMNQNNPRVKASMIKNGITKEERRTYLMPLPEQEQIDCGFEANPRVY